VETVDALRFRWEDLPPVVTGQGSGGVVRQALADFEVEEVALYEPSGEGSHAYFWVEKRGLTTRALVQALMAAGIEEKAIGAAGLKDKYAVTRQWLSVPQRSAEEAFEALEQLGGVTVLRRSRHRNKLAIGHLRGNRFRVRVREVLPGGVGRAETALAELVRRGVPNYFGPQRFGRFGTNALDGLKVARGERVPGGHRLKRFFVSALQSRLFNEILARRVREGLFDAVVTGDWAKKHATGGVFLVEDGEAERARARAFEISAMLPLYGKKVKASGGEAGRIEAEALEALGLRWLDFTSRKGDRRVARIPLDGATLEPAEGGYWLDFTLPKGAFATTVLREVTGRPVDAIES
jgi:tRNA pseudouridine13 synthase